MKKLITLLIGMIAFTVQSQNLDLSRIPKEEYAKYDKIYLQYTHQDSLVEIIRDDKEPTKMTFRFKGEPVAKNQTVVTTNAYEVDDNGDPKGYVKIDNHIVSAAKNPDYDLYLAWRDARVKDNVRFFKEPDFNLYNLQYPNVVQGQSLVYNYQPTTPVPYAQFMREHFGISAVGFNNDHKFYSAFTPLSMPMQTFTGMVLKGPGIETLMLTGSGGNAFITVSKEGYIFGSMSGTFVNPPPRRVPTPSITFGY